MPSTRHDPTVAALHASTSLPGHVVDVVVLTGDAGLLATLREGSRQEHALWHAPAAETAVDLLVGGRCGILVADLETLRGDTTLLEQLLLQFPELVLLATGRREEEQTVASLLTSGRIYRFLHKPVSPSRAKLFLGTATRRYNELKDLHPVATASAEPVERDTRWVKMVAIGLAVSAALIAVWMLMPPAQEEDLAPAPPATSVRNREHEVAELLGHAQMAYAADRLAEPKGNNALQYFRSALAVDPRSVEAHAGIERVLRTLEARVAEALAARNAERAVAAFKVLQRAAPDHPRLESLRAQLLAISRARPGVAAMPPAPPVATSKPQAVPPGSSNASIEATRARIATAELTEPDGDNAIERDLAAAIALRERGQLIEPAGENAYERVLSLRERAPAAAAVREEQQRLASAMLDRAQTALTADNLDEAEAFLKRADALAPDMNATRSLEAQVASARAASEFMKDVVPVTSLTLTRSVPPRYPSTSERDHVEGYVDVEFTVAIDGTTRDFRVKSAQPADVFEKAALDAVAQWRFAPVMKNGSPAPQRAAVRVRFSLQ